MHDSNNNYFYNYIIYIYIYIYILKICVYNINKVYTISFFKSSSLIG